MKRRLELQKEVAKSGGRVDGCPPCWCGGERLVDSPADYDPLKPEYRDWHESYDCYEFSAWRVFLMRCQRCSRLFSYRENRLTNAPLSEIMQ
jgi:hypothetical protein